MVYILVYMAIHAINRNQQVGHETPVYNVIVATLLLVACRFYASAETPYNLVLIGILACRGWYTIFYNYIIIKSRGLPRKGLEGARDVPGHLCPGIFARAFFSIQVRSGGKREERESSRKKKRLEL